MKLKEEIINKLQARGVELSDIAEVAYHLQKPYSKDLKLEDCLVAVKHVLEKREVQYTVLTGIALDILVEEEKVEGALAKIIREDEPLYGVDESLALAIANIYGSVGFTSFGYLDKDKMGIMKELDTTKEQVNTFLDDLVAGVASAASAKIAHQNKNKELDEAEIS
ncbi:phosphatidylglycerophosphatase A-like protein [Halobacteroides halobius DSM 5150]|uniref:Phosphatidylglycerophosphatase A-like protein n=1 Tax=Halobacteroides halobius (strain ATCC 35273 / DSM 5150 / MD-1) TaxID=748449 RepID=L0K5V3_HALHC|nr:phosphatidylglycerophosphatase A [Halobacteroides halobius]AGB40381.1 phosphatidylglycerophosphatase A-like protein [Halobacteroides halobius DSM 5150]